MDTLALLQRFGIAAAIGLLIGVERGWRDRERPEGTRVAGVRTFTLMSVFGALWAALVPAAGPWPLAAGGVALGGALALFEWREVTARGEFSVTSVVVGLATYALGAFAMLGDMSAAIAVGIAVTALLVSRQYLHDFLKKVTWPELRAAVILLAMTFLALPVLPDRTIDPWHAINPHDIWLMTVLMAAISYAGYLAVRLEGGRSALVYGAMAGALISSTLVTLVNARLAAKTKDQTSPATAVCLAWAVSLTRMTGVAAVVNIALLPALAAPTAAAVAVLALWAYGFSRSASAQGPAKMEFGNPFDLLPVLGLGALLAVIMTATKLLNDAFGQSGVLPLAAISGFADVDPVTISVARVASGGGLTPDIAVHAILLAAGANMITKMGVCLLVGGLGFGLRLAGAGITAIAAVGAVVLVV